MSPLPATLAGAVGLFAGTNLDDLVVLAVLNVTARAGGRPRRWQIWLGQYLGVAALSVLALAAASGLTLLPGRYAWLLGFVPVALGAVKLARVVRDRRRGLRSSPAVAAGLPGVIGLTLANGGDNIAAYTPVFATLPAGRIAVTLATFAVLVAVWCAAGAWLVSHDRVTRFVGRWGHWIVPVVFVAIGLSVFAKAGVPGV